MSFFFLDQVPFRVTRPGGKALDAGAGTGWAVAQCGRQQSMAQEPNRRFQASWRLEVGSGLA